MSVEKITEASLIVKEKKEEESTFIKDDTHRTVQEESEFSKKLDDDDDDKSNNKSSDNNSNKSSDNTSTDSENCCWICFGTKDLTRSEVCHCKGNDAYVHDKCLLRWIHSSGKTKCCKCNYEYNIRKEYSYKWLAYVSPFLTLVFVSMVLIGLLHYFLCSFTNIHILSVFSFRFLLYEIDALALLMITVAFSYVYYYDEYQHDLSTGDGETSLLELLSKMFQENFNLTGLEIMLLYNIESSFSFISIRLLLILYETVGNYIDSIIQKKFTQSTILPRST